MLYIAYLPYIPNIPYFPNMPYQTDHTHHTYHTTQNTPTTPQGGGRGKISYGGSIWTYPMGGRGGWQGLVHIYIYMYDYVTLSQGNQKRLILPTNNGDIMRTIMFGIWWDVLAYFTNNMMWVCEKMGDMREIVVWTGKQGIKYGIEWGTLFWINHIHMITYVIVNIYIYRETPFLRKYIYMA